MTTLTLDAFIAVMESRPAAMREAEKAGLDAAGKLLQNNAKAMIGAEIEQWADLAPSTVEEKTRLGYVGRVSATDPLLRTGELRASIGHVVEDHAVVLGSTDPVAPFQEYGTGPIPPRPFIGSTMFRDGHEAADLVGNYVMGALDGKNGPLRPVQKRDSDWSTE
jgi:phage gpG-like protein